MHWQRLLLIWSIVLTLIGLFRSFHYESLIGTNGSGYQIGFELSPLLTFGLIGMVTYFAKQRLIHKRS